MNKLTVGIPTKDRGIEIALLLYSLINQTYQDYNILIIDDNSNNFLYENSTIKSLFNIHENLNHNIKILKGDNKGPQYSGQKILDNSESELIFRCDDDVVLQPDCLEKLIKCFDNNNIVAVGPIYITPIIPINKQIIDLNNIDIKKLGDIKLKDNELVIDGQLQMNYLLNSNSNIQVKHLHSGFIYKTEKLKEINGYFLGYSIIGHHEETDVSYRLFLNGGKLLICPEAICFHFHPLYGGIRTDSNNNIYNESLWLNDDKIFIKRFLNNFNNSNTTIKNKKNINVDIVIITHKKTHNKLVKLIDSIYKYTTCDYKLIIVNNDSDKNSKNNFSNIINKYNNILSVQLDSDVSISEARNIGAKKCDSDYICFIDDDSLILDKFYDKDWLEILYDVINEEKDIGCVGHIKTWYEPLRFYSISTSCMMVKKNIFEQVGGFDKIFSSIKNKLFGYEDIDFSFRLFKMGYKVKDINNNFPFYHENITHKEKEQWLNKGMILSEKLLLSKHDNNINKFRFNYPLESYLMNIKGNKLNVGCYFMKLDNFINIDINNNCFPDIISDIRELNFKNKSINLILISHTLEHFDLFDVKLILYKFKNWLKNGSYLIIEVPDIGTILDKIDKDPNKYKIEDFYNEIYGDKNIVGMEHKIQFDKKLLKNLLLEVGFSKIIDNKNTLKNNSIRFDVVK